MTYWKKKGNSSGTKVPIIKAIRRREYHGDWVNSINNMMIIVVIAVTTKILHPLDKHTLTTLILSSLYYLPLFILFFIQLSLKFLNSIQLFHFRQRDRTPLTVCTRGHRLQFVAAFNCYKISTPQNLFYVNFHFPQSNRTLQFHKWILIPYESIRYIDLGVPLMVSCSTSTILYNI